MGFIEKGWFRVTVHWYEAILMFSKLQTNWAKTIPGHKMGKDLYVGARFLKFFVSRPSIFPAFFPSFPHWHFTVKWQGLGELLYSVITHAGQQEMTKPQPCQHDAKLAECSSKAWS